MKQQFNITIRNSNPQPGEGSTRLVPVVGTIIKDHPFLPVTLFIHHPPIDDEREHYYGCANWTITEYQSGFRVASGSTRKEALTELDGILNRPNMTLDIFNQSLQASVKSYGKAN